MVQCTPSKAAWGWVRLSSDRTQQGLTHAIHRRTGWWCPIPLLSERSYQIQGNFASLPNTSSLTGMYLDTEAFSMHTVSDVPSHITINTVRMLNPVPWKGSKHRRIRSVMAPVFSTGVLRTIVPSLQVCAQSVSHLLLRLFVPLELKYIFAAGRKMGTSPRVTVFWCAWYFSRFTRDHSSRGQ